MNTTPFRILLLSVVCLLVACGGIKPRPDGPVPTDKMDLDPMLIKASVDGNEVTGIEALDSKKIWDKATKDVKRGRYLKAIDGYALLVEHFPETTFFVPSLYNTGWAFERLERWDDAVEQYKRVIEEVPGESSATDAMYRLAECYAKQEKWADVLTTVTKIEGRSGLDLYDRIELEARLGEALLGQNKLSKAEKSFRKALQLNARAPMDKAVPVHSHFIAASHFGISRVYHKLFLQIKLVLPVEKMETDLEDKAQLFKQAQSRYLTTIRGGNPYWASASRYYLAKMYEDFYSGILTAEIPDDLDAEQAELYFEELRKKIRPLMDRALRFYEKTIIISERANVDNDFTRKTQASLERLKAYLNNEELQANDEKMIRSGKMPETLGAPPARKDASDRPMGVEPEEESEDTKGAPGSLRRPIHEEQEWNLGG